MGPAVAIPGLRRSSWAHDGELCAGEVAVPSQLVQTQLDPARQQRRTPTQRDRRDRHDDLVQQPRVGELTGQVSPADNPDVPVTGGADHLLVHGFYVRAGELNSRVGDDRQLAVCEDPARDLVRPLPLGPILVRELVVEDPFVRRRPHRHRTDAGDELAVVQRPVVLALAGEQPVQRVVGVGDKAVEGGRRVVLSEAHHALPFLVDCWRSRNHLIGSPWATAPRQFHLGGLVLVGLARLGKEVPPSRWSNTSSYTTTTTCTSCGRVAFGGGWQDVGKGLQGYRAARAGTNRPRR